MKGSDLLSLGIGAVVVYILYQWMQGAKAASGAVTNTLQQAPVGGSSQLSFPPGTVCPAWGCGPAPVPVGPIPVSFPIMVTSGGGSANGGLLQP